jgi:flagellar M-ring protein FliF
MDALLNTIKGLGAAKTTALALVVAGVLGFFGYLMMQASQPDMGLLFSNVDPADGAKIVDKLKANGIAVEIREDGAAIYAPMDKIPELRMQLAQDGLPNGGSIGYELFDKSDVLGTSSVMLDINQMRALEGELARSIKTVQGVQSARVHLVIPKRELFSKEKAEAAASVVVKMKGAAKLSANQIQAVQYFVSSAVPNLTSDKISIIDDKGTLLARGRETNGGVTDAYGNNINLKNEYEEKMGRQLELLLEKTLGLDKVRAEVSVEMDFDKITTQSVDYNPEGQVAKTTSTSSEGAAEQESGASDSVSIQNALPDGGAGGAGASKSKNNVQKTEENTNFEISNTTKTMVKEAGTLKRLSVAVLVDGNYDPDANGKMIYKPRTEEEINQLTELVKTAVGFKEDRGDIVKVVNMKFTVKPEDLPQELPWFMKILAEVNIKKAIENTLLALFGLILLFGWVKPMITKIVSASPKLVEAALQNAQQTDGYSGSGGNNYNNRYSSGVSPIPNGGYSSNQPFNQNNDISVFNSAQENYQAPQQQSKKIEVPQAIESMINIDNIEGRVRSSSIRKMSEVIDRHPDEAVTIIRNWMYS